MSSLKSTGIEWIPFIKSNWKLGKVQDIFYLSKELSSKDNPIILSLARSAVKIRDISNNEGQLAASYENYNSVKVGDLLLNPMDLYSGANCNVSYVEGVISPAYMNLRAKVKLEPRFYDFYFKVQYWSMAFFAHGKGVSFENRWTLNKESLLNYEVPIPNYEEQKRIVEVLDKKITQIDLLISNQEKQIEKFNLYLYAEIERIINTNCIETRRLKDLTDVFGRIGFRGYTQKDLVEKGNGAITISPSNLNGLSMDYQKCSYLSWDKYYESPEIMLENGDIIFVKTGSSFGKCSLVNELPLEATINPQLVVLKNARINSRYLLYALQTQDIRDQIECSVVGGTIPTISQDKIGRFKVKITNNPEKIINEIDKIRKNNDRLVQIKYKKIEQLQMFKKSLIYEFVTGKKQVL